MICRSHPTRRGDIPTTVVVVVDVLFCFFHFIYSFIVSPSLATTTVIFRPTNKKRANDSEKGWHLFYQTRRHTRVTMAYDDPRTDNIERFDIYVFSRCLYMRLLICARENSYVLRVCVCVCVYSLCRHSYLWRPVTYLI